eukprot:2021576-Pyramimonas_sp.AAC.1
MPQEACGLTPVRLSLLAWLLAFRGFLTRSALAKAFFNLPLATFLDRRPERSQVRGLSSWWSAGCGYLPSGGPCGSLGPGPYCCRGAGTGSHV